MPSALDDDSDLDTSEFTIKSSCSSKIKIPSKSKKEKLREDRLKKQENARVEKWKEMLEYMDTKQLAKFHPKLKNRGRKGVPAIYRGQVWCQLSHMLVSGYHKQNLILKGKNPKLEIHDNKYELMAKGDISKLIKNLINEEGDKKIMNEIHKDVSRTLPNHIYFQD